MTIDAHALIPGHARWPRRLWLDRPRLGPLVIALATLVVFHTVVGLTRPSYWFGGYAWDEVYYLDIARWNYDLPLGNYRIYTMLPFSPAWPMVLRAMSHATGLPGVAIRLPLSALLFIGACQAFGWTLRAFSTDHVRNNLVILFSAFWPGSIYFCTGYAEALYWPLLLLCFGCMLRRRWFAAAGLAADCWFTRTPGVIVVGSLAAAIVIDACAARSRVALVRGAVTLLSTMPIAALGMVAYMALTHAVTGDWFSFRKAYVAWEPCEVLTPRELSLRTLADALFRFPERPTLYLAVAWFLATPFLIVTQRRRMPPVLSVFGATALLFFLVNDSALEPFHDMLRWLAVVFPLHYALVSLFLDRRPPWRGLLCIAWLLASLTGYAWFVHRFVTSKLWVS